MYMWNPSTSQHSLILRQNQQSFSSFPSSSSSSCSSSCRIYTAKSSMLCYIEFMSISNHPFATLCIPFHGKLICALKRSTIWWAPKSYHLNTLCNEETRTTWLTQVIPFKFESRFWRLRQSIILLVFFSFVNLFFTLYSF